MDNISQVLEQLGAWQAATAGIRSLFMSDLVMLGEIPSPTYGEAPRIEFILNRFFEAGLDRCSTDEKGNGIAFLPGTQGHQTILVTAHADTLVTESKDQSIEVHENRMIGPFVGDNCIALAAMTHLPGLMQTLQVKLKSNLVLLASTRALGRGNLDGIRHFLSRGSIRCDTGLCLESVQLGRLNYACMGMLRAEIHCQLPDQYNWAQYGASGTIIPMADVVMRISRIPLPKRPLTTIIMGKMDGGIAHNNIAREIILGFEVRSESTEILRELREKIEDITEETSAQSGTRITLDVLSQRDPGGLDIGHPLVKKGRAVLSALGLQPMLYPTTSQLSALRDAGIPGLTIAITTGERRNDLDEIDESVAIDPMTTGLTQLAGILAAMDEGVGA